MNLYQFISENEVKKYEGDFVVLDNKIYTNPSDEIIQAAGYKPLVEDLVPAYDIETQYVVFKYVDSEEKITKIWEVQDAPKMD